MLLISFAIKVGEKKVIVAGGREARGKLTET